MENNMPKEHTKFGKIEVYIGPMFSGKTSKIMEKIRVYSAIGKKVFCVNHKHDIRYGDDAIFTHYGEKVPAIMTTELMSLINNTEYHDSDLIAINEGQFFPDLVKFALESREKGKDIVICALDGDYKQEMFKVIIDLLPKVDYFEKLLAKCKICCDGTNAPFTHRLDSSKEQVLIGSDIYIPVCSGCLYALTHITKVKRPASEYNLFIKKELEILKLENPDIDQKKRFQMATEKWTKKKNSESKESKESKECKECIEDNEST